MEYPAEYQGAAPETLARLAVSKVMTLTSTYDHRIIQGAQSGDFLRRITGCCSARTASTTSVPRAAHPLRADPLGARHLGLARGRRRQAGPGQELIHAYRVRGHLMADTDPLEFRQRSHPDLDVVTHG
jgi:2-oxoglutarate dehydrogenase E1 component